MAEHPRSAEDLLDSQQVPELRLVVALLDLDADALVVLEAPDEFSEEHELGFLLLRPLSTMTSFVSRTCSWNVLCPPESLELVDESGVFRLKRLEKLHAVVVVAVVVGRDVDCCGLDFLTSAVHIMENSLVSLDDVLELSLHPLSLVTLSYALLVGNFHAFAV